MTESNAKIVILAGGQGSRFWPISRMTRPKQFLSISSSGESLIQATARRVKDLVGEENVCIATNILHVPLIEEHVPYARLIVEPIGKNTAASIGLSALLVEAEDPEAVMATLPADHAVANEANLRKTLARAIAFASKNDVLVTIGIPPQGPNTAYGYIRRAEKLDESVYKVDRFYEKPSVERAKKYLEMGGFYWNSGMFVFKAKVFLAAVEEFMPELFAGLEEIRPTIGTSAFDDTVLRVFESLESISVDFGIMEHARNCAVVEAEEYGWNDVGSWDAWAEHFDSDENGNLLNGDALAIGSKDCVVHSEGRTIAVVGAQDLIVIDSGDAILVCPRDKVQDVREVVKELKARGREELV